MQNGGWALRWQLTQMLVLRLKTTVPWVLFQRRGCGICRPLWHLVQKVRPVWHSAHWPGEMCSFIAILEAVAGMPLMWHRSQSAESFLPSVSYTHLRAHETDSYLVCRLLLE